MMNRSGFFAIHSNHLEDLRYSLVHLLRTNPLGPLDEDVVLIQSNGIAQWLKQALAEAPHEHRGGLGIAAGLKFQLPSEFIWSTYRAVLPEQTVPLASPFDKSRLVWRLYRLLPNLVPTNPIYKPLERFLLGDEPQLRTYQLAQKLADLFDQYQVYRADWLAAWEAGDNHYLRASGEVADLGEDRWQSELWREVLKDVGHQLAHTSRSQVHTRFMQAARDLSTDVATGLPKRVILFGLSSLPYQTLEALSALSSQVQVILFVLNPSEYYWADIVSGRDLLRASRKRGLEPLQQDFERLQLDANPILAGWGKQGRDFIRLLDEFDDPQTYRERFAADNLRIDIFNPYSESNNPTLLHQLQNDIYQLTPLSQIKQQKRSVDPHKDLSLSFHNAHSPLREVEILHDQLLAAFNDNKELQPRDVMVMVPDINLYAPFINAVFGRHMSHSANYIPYTVSDQGSRHRKPLLVAFETLLGLSQSRFNASDILSLLEAPALRLKMQISEDELPLIRRWVEGANIRWGLNQSQRHSLGLVASGTRNSWHEGLRRMLLGYALGRNEAWAGVESYSEISGTEALLAGRLAKFIDELDAHWQALQVERSALSWCTYIGGMIEQFFDDSDADDQQLIDRIRSQIERLIDEVNAGLLFLEAVPLKVVTELLLSALDSASISHRFLSGCVNFATLMPMRAIPFKHICLLGMNDGDYPRSRAPLDFDLMAHDYRPGDRSRRDDDRYLFLEALLSAREHLYISWVGRSINDDSERPASVLVGQLRDHIASYWSLHGSKESLVDRLTITHPLQPFSRDYFPDAKANSSINERVHARQLFTFDSDWHAALDRPVNSPLLNKPLSRSAETRATCAELSRFLKNPIQYFYQQRLKVYFDEVSEEDLDTETFALEGLGKWSIEDELIRELIVSQPSTTEFNQPFTSRLERYLQRFARRGALGIASVETILGADLRERMTELDSRYGVERQRWHTKVEQPLNINWTIPCDDSQTQTQIQTQSANLSLIDSIGSLYKDDSGDICRLVVSGSKLQSGSTVRYAALLSDWVIHLAGQLGENSFTTRILAKDQRIEVQFDPLETELAQQLLRQILESWFEGQRRALPLLPDIASAWLGVKDTSNRDIIGAKAFSTSLERDKGYLQAAYPSYDSLINSGEFGHLSQMLIEPLILAKKNKLGSSTT